MRTIKLDFGENKKYYVEEAYKTLRANIQFCGTDVKAIAITSCHPNEGKSTVSIEISKSLAEAGKKVLLIDADLRKSVVVKKYASEAGICGLSQYLSGQNSWEEVLFATQVEGFHIVFAGQFPANPVELLGSSAFSKMIEEQTKIYDYVIVDTPPLGVVIDCAVIANACDSAIMVIASEKISIRRATVIKNQLAKSGVHILGVVLNMVRSGHMVYPKPYGSNHSYSKYEYSSKKTKNGKKELKAQESLED